MNNLMDIRGDLDGAHFTVLVYGDKYLKLSVIFPLNVVMVGLYCNMFSGCILIHPYSPRHTVG